VVREFLRCGSCENKRQLRDELVRRSLGDDARPGVVVSIATAGDLVQ